MKSSKFDDFCHDLLISYRNTQYQTPEVVAEHFSAFFDFYPPVSKEHLLYFCDKIGLGYPIAMNLPNNISGHYCKENGNIVIGYRRGDWDGGIKHTILHEIWELIQEFFYEIYQEKPFTQDEIEKSADNFALAALMPKSQFVNDCIKYSFNPIQIQNKYGLSYISVLLRMRQVCKNISSFMGLLYQNSIVDNFFKNRHLYNSVEEIKSVFNIHHNIMLRSIVLTNDLFNSEILSEYLPENESTLGSENEINCFIKSTLKHNNSIANAAISLEHVNLNVTCFIQMLRVGIVNRIFIIAVEESCFNNLKIRICQ